MKSIFRSFVRRGIPVLLPANPEHSTSAGMTARSKTIVLFLSIGVAAIMSLLVYGVTWLMQNLYTYSGLPGLSRDHDDQDILILIIPVAIALIIASFTHFYGSRPNSALRALYSLIFINAGIPLGLEGAITDVAYTDINKPQWIGPAQKQILSAAGMTAGIAFLFGSPLTAIALVIELLIIEFTWPAIVAVALAGGTGLLFHYLLLGSEPVFTMPVVATPPARALIVYMVTGLLTGLVAILAGKLIRGMTSLFQKLPVAQTWWPVIAALFTGTIGYYTPEVLGAGYEHIDSLLLGQITLQFLVVMVVGKLLLMSIAAGSGIPGGTIIPLLAAGGALGVFITFLLQAMFPAIQLNFALAALTGMAAMFAAGNRVLPAAIFFAIETTHITGAIIPVICAATIAYLMVFLLAKKKSAVPVIQQPLSTQRSRQSA